MQKSRSLGWEQIKAKPAVWVFSIGAIVMLAVVFFLANRPVESRFPSAWDPRVSALVDFVEAERQLEFKHPVTVRYASPQDIAQEFRDFAPDEALDAVQTDETDETDDLRSVIFGDDIYRAYGLIEGGLDLASTQGEYTAASVAAYYDVAAQTMVIPIDPDELTDELPLQLRPVVVHELVHALQAQHFGQFGFLPPVDPNVSLGIVEGDASRVESQYINQLSFDEQLRYWEQAERDFAEYADDVVGFPTILAAEFADQYVLGEAFIEVLFRHGGLDAVNDVYANPPSDTTALLDPWGFVDGDTDGPSAGDVTEGVDSLVASDSSPGPDPVWWFLMFTEALAFDDALTAARSWGDSNEAVFFGDDDQVCFRVRAVGDDSDETAVMLEAAQTWASRFPSERSADSASGGDMLMTGCDPGVRANLDLPADLTSSLWGVVFVIRGETWAQESGLPRSVGACAAHELIRTSRDSVLPDDFYAFDDMAAADAPAGCI